MGQGVSALPHNSDVNLLRYRDGVIDFDAKISDGTLNLGMSQQKLDGTQVAGPSIDQCRFRASKAMCSKQARI
jgi:hypothetical protein